MVARARASAGLVVGPTDRAVAELYEMRECSMARQRASSLALVRHGSRAPSRARSRRQRLKAFPKSSPATSSIPRADPPGRAQTATWQKRSSGQFVALAPRQIADLIPHRAKPSRCAPDSRKRYRSAMLILPSRSPANTCAPLSRRMITLVPHRTEGPSTAPLAPAHAGPEEVARP